MPPSKMGSTAPDRIIKPREAPSRATHGAPGRPAGRWARRSRATKAHGSQAAAWTRSRWTLWPAMKPPKANAAAARPAANQDRPRTRNRATTPAAATISTTAWLTTQASAPGSTAKTTVVG